LSLKKLDFLNRSQLQRLHNLGKIRNTNRVLSELSPYLSSYREGYESIYYLNSSGREYVAHKKVLRKNQFVNHVIMRNEFYLFAGRPTEWRPELKVKDGISSVVTDVWFKANNRFHFLEVDSTQKMSENKVKAQSYLNMYQNKALESHFKYFPPLIWLTTTELRRKQLKKLCEQLPCQVYTLQDLK
jgi:hypothetical protein